MKNDCIFCQKINKENLHYLGGDTVWFEPLNPVTKGHVLVVPIKHVEDFTQDLNVIRETITQASILAEKMKNVNVIISKGKWATQTIKHLHIHLVPRRANDNLTLPWSMSQNRCSKA
jgi:histidine triad (HIT) family protein